MNIKKQIIIYPVFFLITLIFCFDETALAEEPLVLGIHPYLSATELVTKFTPLARFLERELGHPIELIISKDYRDHIDKAGSGEYDLAYMGPASYVEMVARYGKRPLLARLQVHGKPTFQGMIIVRDDSPILTVKDLAGKRFAFGDPESTMSHLIPRYIFWKHGVTIDMLSGYEFMKNHHNVALGVLAGTFDAGAVKEEVFLKYEKRGLRELMRSVPVSEHVFIAKGSLSSEKIRLLRKALYSLHEEDDGHTIMTSIKHSITGMVPVNDEDYDHLRDILHTLKRVKVIQ